MPFPSPNQQCQSMEGVSDVFIFLIIKMSGHIVNHELCCTSKYLFSSEWQSSNSITLRLYNVQHKTTFLGDSAAKIKTVNQFLLATDTSAPFNFFFAGAGLRVPLADFLVLLPETCWLTENIATRMRVSFGHFVGASFRTTLRSGGGSAQLYIWLV